MILAVSGIKYLMRLFHISLSLQTTDNIYYSSFTEDIYGLSGKVVCTGKNYDQHIVCLFKPFNFSIKQ